MEKITWEYKDKSLEMNLQATGSFLFGIGKLGQRTLSVCFRDIGLMERIVPLAGFQR